MRPTRFATPLPAYPAAFLAAALALAACGGDSSSGPAGDGGPAGDAGACAEAPAIAEFTPMEGLHVADVTDVRYNSNPPSSGPHCPAWPQWGVYGKAVPRCNYVHGLEHGAVVVAYNCPGGCPELVDDLKKAVAGFREPCSPARVVLTPDPLLPAGVQVAAATWGWTWSARCWGAGPRAALLSFMQAHVGNAPEGTICASGTYGTPET